MKTRNQTLIVLSILSFTTLVAGCGTDAEERIMTVEPNLAPCYGVAPTLCMLTGEPGSTEQSFFYDGIDGFTFEWGHRYELRVEVTEVANPPEDGSSLDYALLEVIKDEIVDERFELRLDSDFISGDPSSGAFSILSRRDVSCAETTVCDAIAAALTAGEEIMVEFAHSANQADPLIAHRAEGEGTE